MSDEEPKFNYGHSTELFAARKARGESFVVGGIAEQHIRWSRVLSQRAVQLLWFHLTRFLHPENMKEIAGVATTAAMRNAYLPTVTTHTLVERLGNDAYQIDGWIGSDRIWQAVLSGDEAERFWKALDKVLYPLT